MQKMLMFLAAIIATGIITGCSDADVVSKNLREDAEYFKIYRRLVFYNGITDTYIMEMEGLCNVEYSGSRVEVLCKTGPDTYKKHLFGKADNVTVFVEQLEPIKSNPYHYKVIFKPQTILPDITVKADLSKIEAPEIAK